MEHAYIVNEQYLVVYAIGTPWYADDTFLEELLVLHLGNGGSFKTVTDFLEAAAAQAGATLVISGTALASSDRALARLYAAQGFSQEALTLTKEI